MNAIFFYHFMEFTSSAPPENLIPYFSVEGPYVLSMALIIYKVYSANTELTPKNQEKNVRPKPNSKYDYISVKRSDDKRYDATATVSEKSGKNS